MLATDGPPLDPLDPLLRRSPSAAAPAADIDLDALYRAHRRRLSGLAAAVTLDRAVADDIVHDAFAGLTRHVASVRDPLAYLHRSVVNAAVRTIQRRNRARSLPQRPLQPSTIPEVDETWQMVAALPARQRVVVVLRFWEDYSYEQIAEALGLPLGTVKSTLHRALSTLKEQL